MNAKLSEQTDTISEQADEIARLKALLEEHGIHEK